MAKLKFTKMYVDFQCNNRIYNVPAIFLEVPGCNLCCIRPDGKTCCNVNTIGKSYNTDDAIQFINEHKEISHIVIKGGEPLMYKNELEKFLNECWRDGMFITIYTNGTLPILNPLAYNYRVGLYIVDLTEKNIPEPGTTVKINNNEIILGTSDIERMKADNTKWLRELCMYSNDYLLLICEQSADNFNKKAEEVAKHISGTDDPFIENFFTSHPIKEHICFVGSGWNTWHEQITRDVALRTGYKFNKLWVCGDKCSPQ